MRRISEEVRMMDEANRHHHPPYAMKVITRQSQSDLYPISRLADERGMRVGFPRGVPIGEEVRSLVISGDDRQALIDIGVRAEASGLMVALFGTKWVVKRETSQ